MAHTLCGGLSYIYKHTEKWSGIFVTKFLARLFSIVFPLFFSQLETGGVLFLSLVLGCVCVSLLSGRWFQLSRRSLGLLVQGVAQQQSQQLYSTAGREAKDMSGRKISDWKRLKTWTLTHFVFSSISLGPHSSSIARYGLANECSRLERDMYVRPSISLFFFFCPAIERERRARQTTWMCVHMLDHFEKLFRCVGHTK